jgi:peptide/nickel transport system permease protein
MRISDTLASIPGIITGMVIVTVLGQSLTNLIIAVGVASIPIFIRISRASMLSVKNNEFLEAARAIGLSNFRIIFTQALPNALAPIRLRFPSLGKAIWYRQASPTCGSAYRSTNRNGAAGFGGQGRIRSAPWLTTNPVRFSADGQGIQPAREGLRDVAGPN